jgi:hypothetical protein
MRSSTGVISQDAPLADLLRRGFKTGLFANTVVVLMSDHGFHWSKAAWFNNYIQGEYQHRNPL